MGQLTVADLAVQLREEGPQFLDGKQRTKALYVAVLQQYFDVRTRARKKSDVLNALREHMEADIAKLPLRCGRGHTHVHMCTHSRCRMHARMHMSHCVCQHVSQASVPVPVPSVGASRAGMCAERTRRGHLDRRRRRRRRSRWTEMPPRQWTEQAAPAAFPTMRTSLMPMGCRAMRDPLAAQPMRRATTGSGRRGRGGTHRRRRGNAAPSVPLCRAPANGE